MGDRAISHIADIKHAWYALTDSVQNHNGRIWLGILNDIIIPAGGNYTVAMTFADANITLERFDLVTDAVGADAEYFEGGSFSGGTPFVVTNLNRVSKAPIPAVAAGAGVTIDVAGTSILDFRVRGETGVFGASVIGGVGGDVSLIMAGGETYYFTITNNDGTDQTFDFTFELHQSSD